MNERNDAAMQRRQFLKFLGTNLAFVSLTALVGCGGKDERIDSAPAAAKPASRPDTVSTQKPSPPPAQQPESMAGKPAMTDPAAPADLPRLEPDNPQARALGYTHDASEVDAAAYPRYAAGQACENCALFQGQPGEEWAGCSIFVGRAVNAKGWCSAYVAKG